MKCIKVYPILKKTFSDSLTYWINENVNIGDIIEAPLQSKKIWVAVDSIISVNEAKEFIKSQSFTIRKIDKIKRLDLFSLDLIFSVLQTANYYLRPFGEVFSEIIPKKILENLENDTKINKEGVTYINIFPIKEYIKNDLGNTILPIDLYKIDNENIKTINIHFAESEYYRHIFKKFDYRYLVEEFCIRKKIKLNKIETKIDLKNKNLYIIDQNTQSKTKIRKKNLEGDTYKETLNIISPELFSALKKIEKNKENVFLYTLKKGMSSQIMCPDCHHVMRCDTCDELLEIDVKNDGRIYVCSNNHKQKPIDTPCPVCENENLLTLGANIEVVYKEIEDKFDIDIIKIDNENQTKTQIKKEIAQLKEDSKSRIFIGNDFLLNQIIGLNFQFDNIAIISLESLFSIPLYSMEKTIYNKISLISNQVKNNLLIQTRNSENPFWNNLKENDIDKIKNKDELKELNLPPNTTHIQISIPTQGARNKKDLESIKTTLNHYTKYFEDIKKIKTTIHILISKKDYLKNPIIYYLKSLPQYIKTEVDSRNLL